MEPKVLFEDEDLLVIDKPAGMTVNKADTTRGERTVQDWVEGKYEVRSKKYEVDQNSDFYNRGGIVHRLDKETSGILLIAKNPESFENLQRQFKERTVKKKYTALVHGKVEPAEGEINVPVGRLPWNRERFGVLSGGREAMTKYQRLNVILGSEATPGSGRDSGQARMTEYSLLELQPQTGRTHQIRVHLKYLGFPIVADPLYAGRKQAKSDRKWCPRLFLHASEITFRHPRTGEGFTIESKLSDDLHAAITELNSKYEARNPKQ